MTETFNINDKPPLILPAGYEKTTEGIFAVITRKDEDGNEREIKIPLSYTPFDIKEKLENPDTKEVSYKIEFGNKEILISGSDLSNKKGVVMLAGYGVNTIEANAKDLCKYMMGVKALNNIPESLIYDRFGWKADNSFVLGNFKYCPTGKMVVNISSHSKQIDAIHERGTVAGWVTAISGMMKHDNQRFKMYNVCVPPILKVIDESNHSISDYGDTSIGKTLTTLVGMSVYGNPYDLLYSGDSTRVGMERAVTQFCDMPIVLDDAQNIDKKLLDTIIYMIANGVGKLRGAKSGGLQEVLTWRTVGLFTSETPVVTESSYGGLGARIVEQNKGGLGKTDEDAVKAFETGVKDNYGVFAPMLINYILTHQDEIRSIHKESCTKAHLIKGKYAFNQTVTGIAGRMANTYAAIMTAGKVFEMLYKSIGGEEKDSDKIVLSIFERLLPVREEETYTNRGINHIRSWIAANRMSFLDNGERLRDRDGNPRNYKILGNITNEHYNILPSELCGVLDKKFDMDRLINDFNEAGYLAVDKGKKQRTVKLEGTATKVYSIIRERVDIKDAALGKEV